MPEVPLGEDWTDAKLYARYGLTAQEVTFIESQVAPHDDAGADEASEEETVDE